MSYPNECIEVCLYCVCVIVAVCDCVCNIQCMYVCLCVLLLLIEYHQERFDLFDSFSSHIRINRQKQDSKQTRVEVAVILIH